MDCVKDWQLINQNCDEVALNFAGSPKSFPLLRAFQILNQRTLVFITRSSDGVAR